MLYGSDLERVTATLQRITKERDELQWRITKLEMALGPLANLADEIIEQKSLE